MENLITQKQINYIIKLDDTYTQESLRNFTKKEASILIAKLVKAAKHTQHKASKTNAPTKILSMSELASKYGLGHTLDEDGRFYTGKLNTDENWKAILDKYDPDRKHPRLQAALKYLKDIVKQEFGIKIKAQFKWATYTPSCRVIFCDSKKEMYRDWEELNNAEQQKMIYERMISDSFRWKWFEVSSLPRQAECEKVGKKFYETFGRYEDCLRDKYKTAHDFCESFLHSLNYNHTGAFMGDCDYIDCDFFYFVEIEPSDKMEVDEENKVWEELSKWNEEQAKKCKELDRVRHEEYMKSQGARA